MPVSVLLPGASCSASWAEQEWKQKKKMLPKEMKEKKKAARCPTLSGTALCEHTGAGGSGEAIRNNHLLLAAAAATYKMYVLHAWHWTRWSCRRMHFPSSGSASSPNQTPAEQFNDPVQLALAANVDPEMPPHGFEMSHPERPLL